MPVTVKLLNVPTLVILGCAAVVTVPAVVAVVAVVALVAEVAVPAVVANVAFATVPVTLLACRLLKFAPLPMKKLAVAAFPKSALVAVTLPLTVKLLRVPTEVILGCAFVVTVAAVAAVVAEVAVPALVANVAFATIPDTFAAAIFDNNPPSAAILSTDNVFVLLLNVKFALAPKLPVLLN